MSTLPAGGLVISFRDLDGPRPLAARLIAAGRRHPRGWTVYIPNVGSTEHSTFDAAARAVARMTGARRLLIVWLAE